MTMKSQDTEVVTGRVAPGGATVAVGALLSTSALLTFAVGVFALITDELVVSGPGYQYTFEMAGWGWLNIITGLVLAGVALAVFINPVQARIPAIIATCLAIVVSFLWMPYYPTGSIVLIALDIVAIWGVTTWNTSRETV